MQKFKVSFGICAYNEEKNIGNLLDSIENQTAENINITQIIVVSSACRDKTDEIVRERSLKNPLIFLVKEAERRGKASAVNLFLKLATGDICILLSADTFLQPISTELICSPFSDPSIGMTGGRPVPINNLSNFCGFTSHLVWNLAHVLSCKHPKLGEFIAFRNIIDKIPDTAVDEAAIEAQIKERKLNLCYVPEAVVYNRGPATIADYIKQRRRIHAGHLYLKKSTNYKVSSMNMFRLLTLMPKAVPSGWKGKVWAFPAMALEFSARGLGTYDFRFKRKDHVIWDMVSTTKELIIDQNNTQSPGVQALSQHRKTENTSGQYNAKPNV